MLTDEKMLKLFAQIEMTVDLRPDMVRVPLENAEMTVDRDGWRAGIMVLKKNARKNARPFRIHGSLSATPALAAESLITSLDVWAEVL